jgi:Tfp pilus assembly protein FimT
VTLSLDPLLSDKPLVTVTQPLFILLLAAVLAGVIVGGIAAWLRQGKWRQAAKRAQAEARAARAEADGLRERLEAAERAAGQPTGAIAYRRPPAA